MCIILFWQKRVSQFHNTKRSKTLNRWMMNVEWSRGGKKIDACISLLCDRDTSEFSPHTPAIFFHLFPTFSSIKILSGVKFVCGCK